MDFYKELSENTYPGRGIMLGKSCGGKSGVIAYFIMGRSVNSRNRVFVAEGEGLRTRAFDESKMADPSLVIYYPVRVFGNTTVVTNGDQTDTVYNFLKDGKTFEDALRTRTFEPDPPILTPRISGVITVSNGDMAYKLSILKSADGNGESVRRFFYEYSQPVCGEGHFIHTYKCDGDPVPSFYGEPKTVSVCDDIDTFTKKTWESLNENNKVSLFVRYIDLATGTHTDRIVNRHA